MHLVSANVSMSQPLPANGAIQLAFDRLLLPSCITRQSFILQGNSLTPTVAYDPVARVVTITPTDALIPDQTYELDLASPENAGDPNGVRAIDGATLAPGSINRIEFLVSAATPAPTPPPTIDFCNDVFTPVLQGCGGSGCHGTALPAAGLLLATTEGVAQTAIGRVARGSNTGPRAAPHPPGLLFGEDMPIIDPGTGAAGNPGDSWLLYKMLMAVPEAGAGPSCDGGADANDAGEPSEAASPGDATVSGDATVPGDAAASGDSANDAAAPADGGTPEEAGAAEDAGEDAAPEAPAAAVPPTSVCGLYSVPWQPLSSSERATLSNLVPGREMPYPASLDAGIGTGVSIDALERISLWIAQGATIPGSCSQ